MKNLLIIAIAFVTFQATAQEQKRAHHRKGGNEKMEFMKSLTAEETSDLQTKKMTLHLDLTETQQAKIKAINFEEATLRKAKMEAHQEKMEQKDAKKPSKEERLKMMNKKLDHQIEVKQKMKSILNKEQYNKYEKTIMKPKKNHRQRKNKRH